MNLKERTENLMRMGVTGGRKEKGEIIAITLISQIVIKIKIICIL